MALGYKFPALPTTFEEGTARERHVQRVSKLDGKAHLLLDLMIADALLEGVLDDREVIELDAGPPCVVSRRTLVRMKRLAGRAQDLADLERLGESA